jgi:hypothetical protein
VEGGKGGREESEAQVKGTQRMFSGFLWELLAGFVPFPLNFISTEAHKVHNYYTSLIASVVFSAKISLKTCSSSRKEFSHFLLRHSQEEGENFQFIFGENFDEGSKGSF